MSVTRSAVVLTLCSLLGGCRSGREPGPEVEVRPPTELERATIELVETSPVETVLDNPDLRETWVVWQQMIDGAERSLDLLHFYASDRPDGGPSRLEPVIGAIERAADRGVRVRVIADAGFHATYPRTLDRLDARAGIEVRLYDLRSRTGGVQHAKAMIVDERELFVGSQNLDWRALEHIQELGLRVESQALAHYFGDIFEFDWRWAATPEGEPAPQIEARVRAGDFPQLASLVGVEGSVRLWPAVSPTGLLPDEAGWDLPRLVEWIESAQEEVRLQLLSYKAIGRDKTFYPALENALRGAAARGVRVRLLIADWSKRSGTIEGLQSLAALRGVDVRLVTIPEASEGFIDFARVIHAKFLVVDRQRAWLGTSNWEKSYFTTSRNLGLFAEGAALAERLADFFDAGWESPYAEDVDLGRKYTPPRRE